MFVHSFDAHTVASDSVWTLHDVSVIIYHNVLLCIVTFVWRANHQRGGVACFLLQLRFHGGKVHETKNSFKKSLLLNTEHNEQISVHITAVA